MTYFIDSILSTASITISFCIYTMVLNGYGFKYIYKYLIGSSIICFFILLLVYKLIGDTNIGQVVSLSCILYIIVLLVYDRWFNKEED